MDVFAAIGDPVRRALLRRLAARPARVVDLAAEHPISRPAVSKHLRVLTEAGLVAAEDRGRERHYRLQPGALGPVRSLLDELVVDDASPRAVTAVVDGLDALALEVRRTARDHAHDDASGDRPAAREQEGTA